MNSKTLLGQQTLSGTVFISIAGKIKSALSAWNMDISYITKKETNNNCWKSGQVLLLDAIELINFLQWTIWMVLVDMRVLVTQMKLAAKRASVEGKIIWKQLSKRERERERERERVFNLHESLFKIKFILDDFLYLS